MSITLPDWWTTQRGGGFPNIENLLKHLLADKVGDDVEVTYWLPKPDVIRTHLEAGKGYLRLYRTGGAINRKDNRDQPRVQAAALTPSRDDSWELIEMFRQITELFEHAKVVPGTPHKLQCTGEVVGPQLLPELLSDDRLVPITLEFFTWRTRDHSNQYRQALGL